MYTIVNTTDGKYIGGNVEYNNDSSSVKLPNGSVMNIYKKVTVDKEIGIVRLSNSNYCIDIIEVK